jgi:hypothetical protein
VHSWRTQPGHRPDATELRYRLAAAASVVAGIAANVRCQTAAEASVDRTTDLGHVQIWIDDVPERTAVIKYVQCERIADYIADHGRDPDRAEVIAVHVLTHESVHMSGQHDEALTECAAMQRDAQTARVLGADDDDARTVGERYWSDVYPYMPADYRSPDCRAGGLFDEHRPDPPW